MAINKETYKDIYIKEHSEAEYQKKLLRNAQWRADHPERMAIYKKNRTRNGRSRDKTIILISDVHMGASTVDIDLIRRFAKQYWSRNPLLLLGDLCDLGLDRGMEWDQKYGPQKQIDLVEDIFAPLDVRGFCSANHEDRIYQKVGLTPYIRIFGMTPSNHYSINGRDVYFNHGKSAAENFFLEFQKYVKWCDDDVIALGHSHDLARITFLRGEKIQHLVRTGSFLGRPRYVTNSGFAPKICGWAEYDTEENKVYLKALTNKGEVFEI